MVAQRARARVDGLRQGLHQRLNPAQSPHEAHIPARESPQRRDDSRQDSGQVHCGCSDARSGFQYQEVDPEHCLSSHLRRLRLRSSKKLRHSRQTVLQVASHP